MKKQTKPISIPSQPKSFSLVNTFKCKNETKSNKDAAKLIIETAMKLVYGKDNSWGREATWTDEEMDSMLALINNIGPKDSTEVVLTSQFIALHLKSMKIMQQANYNTMGHAMMMMRLSHQAIDMLQKYRGKGQTINVNYNVLNQPGAVLNSMVNMGGQPKKDV